VSGSLKPKGRFFEQLEEIKENAQPERKTKKHAERITLGVSVKGWQVPVRGGGWRKKRKSCENGEEGKGPSRRGIRKKEARTYRGWGNFWGGGNSVTSLVDKIKEKKGGKDPRFQNWILQER